MFHELTSIEFRKCAVLENVELSFVLGGNGNEEANILVLYLVPHDKLKVELQERITTCKENKSG
jgi:hypothetical protein